MKRLFPCLLSAKNFLLLAFICFYSIETYAQPATCTASIGSPANGASHFISVVWALVGGATSYELEVSDNGSTNWINIYTGSATTYSHNSGNLANTAYYYRVRSISGSPSAYRNATQFPIYTACDEPALPQLSNATPSGLSITLPAETPVANPSNTTYSIFCTTTSQYVQANGSLGVSEVFQTRAAWATVAVTGLTASTNYCFYSKARNADGNTQTQAGASISTTETFTTNANFNTSGSAPTNRFWSPASCTTGGLVFSNAEGCPAGSVGFTGTFNNFFGCFLRTPTIDCSGNNTVTLTFDVSHSYSAATPNNRMRIYFFADGAFTSSAITALTINANNALASFGVNGQGISYTETRACGKAVVTFNIAAVSNKSNILFYLEPNCGYNNSQPFFTWIDNVGLSVGGNATACLSTTTCTAPSLQSSPASQAICANGNTSFTVNATGGVAGYQWQENTGGGFANINNGGVYSNANTATLNITGASASFNGYQYRCIITASCGNNLTSNAATLTVNTVPAAATNINGDTSVCKNSSEAYTVATINNATSYNWVLPIGATITNGANTNSVTVAFGSNAQAGNISVAGTNTCGTGTASSALAITINEAPVSPSSIAGNDTVCKNSNENYSIALVNNATSYVWTLPNGATITNGANTNAISVSYGSNAQAGNISVAGINTCGTGTAFTLNVTVNDVPATPSAVNVSGALCVGASITFDVANNATSYTWSVPAGWQAPTSTSNSAAIVIGGLSGTVSVTANNLCGSSLPQTYAVTGIAGPADIDSIIGIDVLCAGALATYEVVSNATVGTTFNWLSDWNVINTTATTITYEADSANTVISVSAENSCGTSAAYTKNVSAVFVAIVFDFNQNPVCSNTAPFELNTGVPTLGTYAGVGVNANGFFSAAAAGTGNAVITYTVEEQGCTFSDTATIVVETCTGIANNFINNEASISPNPFINFFTLKGNNLQSVALYDMAGKIIFSKTINLESSVVIEMEDNIEAGIYFAKVMHADGAKNIFKLIKN
jgi:large repetitive protein